MKTLDLRNMDLPDERVTSWMEANGMDPGLVPADQAIDVSGEVLLFDSFVRDAAGHRVHLIGGRGLRARIEIPHKSRPEAHGLGAKIIPATITGKLDVTGLTELS